VKFSIYVFNNKNVQKVIKRDNKNSKTLSSLHLCFESLGVKTRFEVQFAVIRLKLGLPHHFTWTVY